MLTSSGLIDVIKEYDKNVDEELIKKAYLFSMDAHGLQKRSSGIPYFSHPVEVATILAKMKMDVSTVVTGLLHDVIEDTPVSYEDIEAEFGFDIAFLVNGVTKLSKIAYQSEKVHQADNFRKFLIAISEDVRVLVVKLADRLHNMRTLNAIKNEEKRKRISLETMDIYAPLAERIGMQAIKDELEDRAFFFLYPSEYNAILVKLDQIKRNDEDFIKNVISTLEKYMEDNGIEAIVCGRTKKPCSIWRKMCKRNITLEQLNDIIAFRIIVNTIPECYKALGIIHVNFPICPGRFKDYISIPKLNNYRSLHTTVFGPFQQKIEIQIRTKEMHLNAENGMASHWSYKDGAIAPVESKNCRWLKSLISVLENTNTPEETIADSKLEMYEDDVFCFSPKGDLISLPRNATTIDFAYSIHTAVGNRCIGAKVNGRIVPLRTQLKNGDQVEILTSPFQKPEAAWLQFVVTGKARSCIKKFVLSQERSEFVRLGKAIVKKIFDEEGVAFTELKIPLRKLNCQSLDLFYLKVQRQDISFKQIRDFVDELESYKHPIKHGICLFGFTPEIAVHYATCCNPIPGDRIIGLLDKEEGLIVHSVSCGKFDKNSSAIIDVSWNDDEHKDESFVAKLSIVLLNKAGSLAQVTQIISEKSANIANIKIENRSRDFYDILIEINVRDLKHLGEIQAAITTCSRVRLIRRI